MTKNTFVIPPRARRRRDWERILLDLRSAGCSVAEVARKCGRHAKTVRLWMDGGEPKETDARIVMALYQLCCPEQYTKHQLEFSVLQPSETDAGMAKGNESNERPANGCATRGERR